MHKTKILITGSLGFVYSNFVRKLLFNSKDYEIISVDKATEKKFLVNNYINKYVKHYFADVKDQFTLDNIFDVHRPEVVIHGAAFSSVDESLHSPNEFVSSNVLGTQSMINCSLKYGVQKFILQSTDEVYGALGPNDASWTEVSPLSPNNPYSASKASAELLVQAAGKTFGLPYLIARSSNMYGPRQTTNKLIPRVIKCILDEAPIPMYGDPTRYSRSWLHVNDNYQAITTLIEKGKIGEVYNIDSNQEYNNLEVVQMICDAAEKGHNLISSVPDRLGHDTRYSMDCSKIKLLGWTAKHKFKEEVINCVNWYMDNKNSVLSNS